MVKNIFLFILILWSLPSFAEEKSEELDFFDRTIAEAKAVVQENPESSDAYAQLTLAYHQKGSWTEGLNAAEKATELDPHNPDAYYYHGLLLLDNGLSDEAIEKFQIVKNLDSDYPMIDLKLAAAYREEGMSNEEEALYEKIIEQNPEKAGMAYRNLGLKEFGVQNYAKAIPLLLKAIEVDPEDGEAYFVLAQIYELQNNVKKSVASYEKAMKYDSERLEIYRNLVPLAIEVGNYELAIKAVNYLIEKEPQIVQHYVQLAFAYQLNKKDEKAIEVYQKVLEMDTELPNIYYNLGVIHREQKKFSEAIAYYKRAIAIEGNTPEFHYELAIAYCENLNAAQAHLAYQKSISYGASNLEELRKFLDYRCPV